MARDPPMALEEVLMTLGRRANQTTILFALAMALVIVGLVAWWAFLPKADVPQVEGHLWLMRRDGSNPTELSSLYVNSPPAFGPDGMVYFSHFTGLASNLTVADPTARVVRDLGVPGKSPAPATDGIRLAYGDYGDVKLLFLNNGTRITLFQGSLATDCVTVRNIAFSPNGSLLTWVCAQPIADSDNPESTRVMAYDFASLTVRVLGREADLTFLNEEQVVVQDAAFSLAVKNVSTWQTQRALPGPCAEPAADPDGRGLVCRYPPNGPTMLYSIDLDSSTRAPFYEDPGWVVRWPAVSLDGQWVAFVR